MHPVSDRYERLSLRFPITGYDGPSPAVADAPRSAMIISASEKFPVWRTTLLSWLMRAENPLTITWRLAVIVHCSTTWQLEDDMPQSPPNQWDSSTLHDRSRAWFVTTWPGRCVGAPDADILFVIEIPRSLCLCTQLFFDAEHGWELHALRDLATKHEPPDALITDNKLLHHVLVSIGSSFQKPAAAFLDKPITLMPAIEQCIFSLMEAINQPPFQAQAPIEKINEALELWRVRYNDRKRASPV